MPRLAAVTASHDFDRQGAIRLKIMCAIANGHLVCRGLERDGCAIRTTRGAVRPPAFRRYFGGRAAIASLQSL